MRRVGLCTGTLYLQTVCLLILTGISGVLQAHPLDPAFLQIRQLQNGEISLRWSGNRDFVTQVKWHLPNECFQTQIDSITYNELKWAGHNRWHCSTSSLRLETINGLDAIEGKQLMVDYRLRGQSVAQTAVITVTNGEISLPHSEHSFADAFGRFVMLGLEHIALGVDHLLFVLCLLLLFKSKTLLVRAVTAFTLGHCLTLFFCATKQLVVSSIWTESCIALSLVVLCRELLGNADPKSLIRRFPGMMTLCFGLIHGMGFAAALTELGLGEDHLLAQIAGFNLGVEIGQLMFIALMLSLGYSVQRHYTLSLRARLKAVRLLTYGSGIIATFWFFERLAASIPSTA